MHVFRIQNIVPRVSGQLGQLFGFGRSNLSTSNNFVNEGTYNYVLLSKVLT